MKKYHFITVAILLLVSCESNTNIDGVWISFNNGVKNDYVGNYDGVLKFNGNEILIKGLGLPDDGLEPFEISYSKIDDLLYVNEVGTDSLRIEQTSDTVLKANFINSKSNVFFQKLADQDLNISPWNPENKSYKVKEDNQVRNSVDFVNDSIVLEFYSNNEIIEILKWRKYSFEDYSFLVFNNKIRPYQLLIDSIQNSNLFLSRFSDSRRTVRFEQIDDEIPTHLFGKWKLIETKIEPNITNSKSAPRITDNYEIETLNFERGKIIINTKTESLTRNWQLVGSKKHIFFPNEKLIQENIWQINNLNNSILVITIWENSWVYGYSKKLTFSRI